MKIIDIKTNEDRAMKRYSTTPHQSCIVRVMPVIAILGFTCVADLAAQDAGRNTAQDAMHTETENYFSAQEQYVLKSLSMASKSIENKDYETALKILDVSRKILG